MITKCTGEAHSNAFIDHCEVCAPRWGWMVVSEEKPDGLAGLIITKPNKINLGSWVTVYEAAAQAMDPNGGKYVVVCEAHNTICDRRTKQNAIAHMQQAYWCEECQELGRQAGTIKAVRS